MDPAVKGKKRRSVEKPLCKYGASCYQKNPEHRKKFKHPTGKETIVSYLKENSLNDVPHEKNSAKSPKNKKTEIAANTHAGASTDSMDEISSKKSYEANTPEISIYDARVCDVEETVDVILKSMPKDFFDFWKFCSSVNASKPESAFSDFGYHLVGVFDLLSKKLSKNTKVDISCHWRYFYDPPEFQTVIKKDKENCFHIGYFRDDPWKKPSILASNYAGKGPKLTLMGDNIFCAMNIEMNRAVQSSRSNHLKNKATELGEALQKFALEKKYTMEVNSSKTKKRQRDVVAKTFHGLGIVVPVKNDIGYRELPESDAALKSIIKKIFITEDGPKRLDYQEQLEDIITNVQFANDECDYGMGLELGIDLFCYGEPCLNGYILTLLPLAYKLLERFKYASIIESHLKNRIKGENLCTLKW